jgi:hypothetical protein
MFRGIYSGRNSSMNTGSSGKKNFKYSNKNNKADKNSVLLHPRIYITYEP